MRLLAGVPLIGHSIQAALSAKSLDRVLVSTDSREIADYATRMGVPTQRLRPVALAGDLSSTVDVVKHEVIAHAAETGERFEHVLLLQPTSPLRSGVHIDEAVSQYLASGAPSLISVCEVGPNHPEYMYRRDGLHLEKLLSGEVGAPRQNMERLYLRNGAIYVTATRHLEETNTLASARPAFYVMDRRSSINIDDPDDLLLAEALLRT